MDFPAGSFLVLAAGLLLMLAAGLFLMLAAELSLMRMPTNVPTPPAMSAPRPLPPPVVAPPRQTPRRWDDDIHACPRKGQFLRFFRMKVTAYTPINTRMEGGRYTSTLRDGRAEHGVAVDPDLIPLGSHLWIPGYGHAIADDVGGRIRGHHVDLRMQVYGHMGVWGVRHVRVYVLRDP